MAARGGWMRVLPAIAVITPVVTLDRGAPDRSGSDAERPSSAPAVRTLRSLLRSMTVSG